MSAEADFRQPNRIDLRSRCIETAPGFACLYGDHYPTLVAVLGDGWQLSDPVLGDPNVEITATAPSASAAVAAGPIVGSTVTASAPAAAASVSAGPVVGVTITASASAASASVSAGPVIGASVAAVAPVASASVTAGLVIGVGPVIGATVGAAAAPATAALDVSVPTALGSYPTPRASRLDVLAFLSLSVALTSRKLAPYPSRVDSVSVPRWTRRRPVEPVPVYLIVNRPLRNIKL